MYTIPVKNITLSADESLIEEARNVAKAKHTTVNAAFREWLAEFTGRSHRAHEFDDLMASLKHIRSNGPYTREEMNER